MIEEEDTRARIDQVGAWIYRTLRAPVGTLEREAGRWLTEDEADDRYVVGVDPPEVTLADATPGNAEGVASMLLAVSDGESFYITVERA